MYYEFENELTALWVESLGGALTHAHITGNRITRVIGNGI